MPNPNTIKYSTSTQSQVLRKGNLHLGVTDKDYGPSNTTGFYNGVTSSGYTTYLWDGSELRYNVTNNATDLTNFLSSRAGVTFDGITSSLIWASTQSTIFVTNRTYENIITNGLVLNLDAGFVSSYPSGGTTWFDLGGNQKNGTLTNGPTFDGTLSIAFDGTNDYILLPSISTLISQDITVSIWIKFDTISGIGMQPILFGVEQPYASATYFYLYRNSFWDAGQLSFLVSYELTNSTSTSRQHYSAAGYYVTGQWYNIVVMYDATGRSKYYTNGALLVETAPDAQFSKWVNLANGDNYFSYLLDGNSASLQVYNRALTTSEVIQNYQSMLPRFTGYNIVTSGLAFYLDAGYGLSFTTASNTWFDISGYTRNTTLINGPTYSSDGSGSILFDGTNDYATMTVPLGSNWSISCWFKINSLSSPEGLYNVFSTSQGGPGWYVSSVFANGTLQWYIDGDWRNSSATMLANTWYNLVATINGNNYRYHLNGNQVLSYTSSSAPGTDTFRSIGRIQNINQRYFNGRVAMLFAYTKALSAAEITQNFNAIRSRFGV